MAQNKSTRRNFLVAVGAGGAAVVATVGTKSIPQKAANAVKKNDKRAGYQLTEHVRNYYRTTLV